VTSFAERKLGVYAGLAAAGLLAAVVLGRAELAALAAPFALFVVAALALAPRPECAIAFVIGADRAVEGDEIEATLELAATTAIAELEVGLVLPPWIELAGQPPRAVLRLARGERRTLPFRLACRRWGAYRLGELEVRAHDRLGVLAFRSRLKATEALRVHPRQERLRSLVRPLETQLFAGNRVARAKGEGIEFADLRPFVAGDRVRRINWRESARRRELYVTEAHPERNSDVVLFLDSFAEARLDRESTLDLAVRAAASLAGEYLEQRDRVGLVSFGGIVDWLGPALGTRQLYQIVDVLLETEVALSYAWKGIDVLPPRSLPPQALVLALSPLLDDRSVRALLDLRARGFDLVVVDVSPLPFAREGADDFERLAYRLWPLWREAVRFRYERLGVAVVEWSPQRRLSELIEEVRGFRRYARRVYG
jgi:uncharacterized protein (DUF58 family)